MARIKVDNDIIKQMNELYLKHKTYSGVAKEIGCAPSTVKKYIIEGYTSETTLSKKIFKQEDLPEFSNEMFKGVKNFGELCALSKEERVEIEELWSELSM